LQKIKMSKIILVAGATGNLGQRISKHLLENGAEVRLLVRNRNQAITDLEKAGAQVISIQNWTYEELTKACKGVSCIVSALAGLRDVVVDAQKVLLFAAVSAGVPRFIPSDYSLDFTRFSPGENRNLDWRREFHTYLNQQPIAATTIFNGPFMDMLTDQMPVILLKQKMILFWGKKDWKWDFTTVENTAQFTAKVALDVGSPRYLRVAGDRISPSEIRDTVESVYGIKFRLFRPGGQSLLGFIIKMARKFSPSENELYPAWQGMQYMHNMIDERSKMENLDNDRYAGMKWTSVKELLKRHQESL